LEEASFRTGGGGGRKTGVAGRWNERGFGFITPDGGSEDVFCHFSAITDGNMLSEGARVDYDESYDERKGKPRAERVTGGIQVRMGRGCIRI
jgi:cold shock CspA family protein